MTILYLNNCYNINTSSTEIVILLLLFYTFQYNINFKEDYNNNLITKNYLYIILSQLKG